METTLIKMFKIITGDVILGSVENTETGVTVHKPVQLILDPTQGGAGMIPYGAVFTQEEIPALDIKEEHIVHYLPISAPFMDAYLNFLNQGSDVEAEAEAEVEGE